MIAIARTIGGISINGKEWLLDDEGSVMKFRSRESAIKFLESKGYENFSSEEFEDFFFFEELD